MSDYNFGYGPNIDLTPYSNLTPRGGFNSSRAFSPQNSEDFINLLEQKRDDKLFQNKFDNIFAGLDTAFKTYYNIGSIRNGKEANRLRRESFEFNKKFNTQVYNDKKIEYNNNARKRNFATAGANGYGYEDGKVNEDGSREQGKFYDIDSKGKYKESIGEPNSRASRRAFRYRTL